MDCTLTDQELWSGMDRNAPELTEHLAHCDRCRQRAAEFRAGIAAVATASEAAAAIVPPLPTSIGPYQVRRRIGLGGMGIVYEAEQQSPRRLVAIKVVRGGPSADEHRIRLFQREAQTLARLKHPGIASVFEAGRTADGQDFFAMELVQGLPLTDYLRANQVPRRDRIELFRRLCDAIHYAHQRGVIHRDLKPTNVIVDAEGNPKVLDFGLARISDAEAGPMTTMHDVGRLMGTLPYMSPEEARGSLDAIDVRSDVYSLGVMFYELLTGQLPYAVRQAALPDSIRVICEESPRRPSGVDRTISAELDTIALKALEKDRARRYQSAAAFGDDLARFLSDQPILARRAGGLYRVRKWLVRHRLIVLPAAASIVLVVAARVWIDRLGESNFDLVQRGIELQELRFAIVEYELATVLHSAGKYSQAEPRYGNARRVFQRLGEDDRAAQALVGRAETLIQRAEPTPQDYYDAEESLQAALRILGDVPNPPGDLQRRALTALLVVYGPDALDWPDDLADCQAEIARMAMPPRLPANIPAG